MNAKKLAKRILAAGDGDDFRQWCKDNDGQKCELSLEIPNFLLTVKRGQLFASEATFGCARDRRNATSDGMSIFFDQVIAKQKSDKMWTIRGKAAGKAYGYVKLR